MAAPELQDAGDGLAGLTANNIGGPGAWLDSFTNSIAENVRSVITLTDPDEHGRDVSLADEMPGCT